MLVNAVQRPGAGALLALVLLHGDSGYRRVDPQNTLVGAWRLVSFTNHLENGAIRQDARSVGYIIYSDSGTMCATIADPNRAHWAARVPTGSEAVAAISGLIAYCGSYQVNAADGSVTHHVAVDRVPNAIGSDRKRWFTFDGPNRLTLRVDPSTEPGVASSTLVWQRIETHRQ